MATDRWTIVIAAYAAIVATGALFLEIRRWFESGPRIRISMMPVAKIYGGPVEDDSSYLAVTVTNFGSSSTTITHMLLHRYVSFWARLRNKPTFSAVVTNPNSTGRPIPYHLDVGSVWHGQTVYNEQLIELARSGNLYVGIACSHRKMTFLKHVKLPNPDNL